MKSRAIASFLNLFQIIPAIRLIVDVFFLNADSVIVEIRGELVLTIIVIL